MDKKTKHGRGSNSTPVACKITENKIQWCTGLIRSAKSSTGDKQTRERIWVNVVERWSECQLPHHKSSQTPFNWCIDYLFVEIISPHPKQCCSLCRALRLNLSPGLGITPSNFWFHQVEQPCGWLQFHLTMISPLPLFRSCFLAINNTSFWRFCFRQDWLTTSTTPQST